MNINTASLLSFLKPSLNESIKTKIESMSKDGKVEIISLLKDKNIQTLLNSLFKDILQGSKSKESVLQSVQKSKPIFDFKNINNDLNDILKLISKNPKLQKQANIIKSFLVDIKDINNENLKSNIKNSGVFLESKLLKNDTSITNDIKASLLQVKEQIDDPKIQKVLDQISYHQLISYSAYSNNTFLPFVWENVEDGEININSSQNEVFTCSIDLKLKNYGEFNSVLLLEKKNNISINLRIQSDVLKLKVQNSLQILREKINKIGLNLVSLNVLKYNDTKTKEQILYEKNITKLSYGIDIKA